jgi:hypothetical protein
MEEGEQGGGWMIWAFLLVCVAGAVAATMWVRNHRSGPRQPEAVEGYAGGNANETAAAVSDSLPPIPVQRRSPEGAPGQAAYARPAETAAKPGARTEAEEPAAARENQSFGFAYGAISRFVARSMSNPAAVAAVFNNEYVVRGFMSRDTVKAATADKASLAAYFKDPNNSSAFMNKPAVRNGLNTPAVVDAVASSKLVAALMDTPGAKDLMNDQRAIVEVLNANPALGSVLADPRIIDALRKNPRTAGAVGRMGR